MAEEIKNTLINENIDEDMLTAAREAAKLLAKSEGKGSAGDAFEAAGAVAEDEAVDAVATADAEKDVKEEKHKAEESEESKKAKKSKKRGFFSRLGNKMYKHRRLVGLGTAALLVVMTVGAWGLSKIDALHPYEISVAGNTVCYVANQADADQVVKTVFSDYAKKGTSIRAVSTGSLLTIKQSKAFKVESVLSTEDAVAVVKDATKGKDSDVKVTIASTKTEVKDYVPEPNYKKDNSMLAGDSKIKVKGKKGSQKVTTTYVTVNGKDSGDEITAREILDEGKPATIIKGTLGLPDGADWKTYDGDPVYKDGEELVTTASYYQGKVPYKWGGRSLATGVSCLGFVKAIYAKYGINLPMSHPGMKASGVGVSYANARKGDIICYKAHVGIYVGNGKMIDATHGSGVSIRKVSKSKLVTVRRIVKK